MDHKVFRNEKLKGVISKDRALSILGMNRSAKITIRNIDIIISYDDFENVSIDYMDEGEPAGGTFDEI
jgi:hypothetical protein